MFTLKDFPIGTNLYWIRKVSNKETQVVYTRYKISGHDEMGNLLSDITRKNIGSLTLIHDKELYLNPNPNNMIIPEILFNIFHNPEIVPINETNELQKIFGSGLSEVDELIKSANKTFEEWNKNRKFETVIIQLNK